MSELRNSITRYANAPALDVWVEEMKQVPVNPYQALALRTFFEEMRRLIRARDGIDAVRSGLPRSAGTIFGWQLPTSRNQRELYEATKRFFDNYYSTLSALSGVVGRFGDVFNRVTFNENARLVLWLGRTYQLRHNTLDDLERARRFRAMLAHPQQFPPLDWATACYFGYEQVHIVLFGVSGRGKNPTPVGATTRHEWLADLGAWQFDAPDEITVTNSVGNGAFEIFADILVALTERSAFAKALTREEVSRKLIPSHIDVGVGSRSAPSAYEVDD
jgi:hypothetical protein